MEVEKRSADMLLGRGVRVKIIAPLIFRIFGKKYISLVVKTPSIKAYLKISRKFLEIDFDEEKKYTLRESFELYGRSGKKASEIVAICLLDRTMFSWMYKPIADYLRNGLSERELAYLYHLIVLYGGIEDFISTIRLICAGRITQPMNLSHIAETS